MLGESLIVVVSGETNSGKSTFTHSLRMSLRQEHLSSNHLSLAKPLKDIACSLYGLSPVGFEALKKYNPTGARQLLIDLTDAFKKFNPKTFATIAYDTVASSAKNIFIVDDLRYPEEKQGLIDTGCKVLEIVLEADSLDRIPLFTEKILEEFKYGGSLMHGATWTVWRQ